jgi:hypothetical protein
MSTVDHLLPVLPVHDCLLNPLASYRGRNRLIIILAPDNMEPELSDQLHQLTRCRYDLEKRDALIFSAIGKERNDLRQYAELMFDARPNKFTLILIGKDGGVMLHREHPISATDILHVLDAMPPFGTEATFE